MKRVKPQLIITDEFNRRTGDFRQACRKNDTQICTDSPRLSFINFG